MGERLGEERERSVREHRFLHRQIEETQKGLEDVIEKSKRDRGKPREDYDNLQDELQSVVDRLTEACAENAELRQRLASSQPPATAPPLATRAAWSGVLEQASGAHLADSSTSVSIGASSRDVEAPNFEPRTLHLEAEVFSTPCHRVRSSSSGGTPVC